MTSIYTVRDNLLKTIKGKEHLLEQYRRALEGDNMLFEQKITVSAASEFVKINLDELYGILNDVQICCKQATEASWIGVDRQGGI